MQLDPQSGSWSLSSRDQIFTLQLLFDLLFDLCVCTGCTCHVVCVGQKTTSGGSFLLWFWELNSGCWSHPEALWPIEASQWLHVRSFMIAQLVRRKHLFMCCF